MIHYVYAIPHDIHTEHTANGTMRTTGFMTFRISIEGRISYAAQKFSVKETKTGDISMSFGSFVFKENTLILEDCLPARGVFELRNADDGVRFVKITERDEYVEHYPAISVMTDCTVYDKYVCMCEKRAKVEQELALIAQAENELREMLISEGKAVPKSS